MESERDTNESNGTKYLPLNTKTLETTVESNQNGHGENTNDKDDSTLSANGNQSESTSCDRSESEVASSSDSLNKNTENVKVKEEPCDRMDVLGLTKKIFSSFPIKLESLVGSEREQSADDSMKNERQKELVDANETNVCMYLSEEKQLFHAKLSNNENNDTNNHPNTKSVFIANGVEYLIRPVEDEQTTKLVFEYFKLVNKEPKGIFSIDISGSLLKNEEDSVHGIDTSSSKEGEITVKEEPMETGEVKSTNDEDEDGARKRKQSATGAKVISPVVNEPKNKKQQPKNDKQTTLKKLYNIIPMAPVQETDSQVYLHTLFAKSARHKRKRGKLLVDSKTDIPILDMKMNMQVTSDTLCQTPQLAPMSKRQMQIFDKDNIMTSPGRKLCSEKLAKVYNSRLFSTAAVDSDDELKDLGLPSILPELKKKKSRGHNPEVTGEDTKKWKKYNLRNIDCNSMK